jgi:hypothetical protein
MFVLQLHSTEQCPVGSRKAPYPSFVQPCDPTLREQAPRGREWLHEPSSVAMCATALRGGHATIYSRHNCTEQFGTVAPRALGKRAAADLCRHLIYLDGFDLRDAPLTERKPMRTRWIHCDRRSNERSRAELL